MRADTIKSSIYEQVEEIDDGIFLEVIDSMLTTYRQAQRRAKIRYDDEGYFDPTALYSLDEIKAHEAREDFIGYSIQGTPLYAEEVFAEGEKEIEAIKAGKIKATTLEEWKQKTKRWQTPTP
ncbi:MAG: hypothetical protein AAFZ52_02900 [Bacteroidota bacterium]